jgi:hypothetical protein
MMNKYVQPKSLTWLTGFTLVLLGVAKAVLPELPYDIATNLTNIVDRLTGDSTAFSLVNFGLMAIGIKGAILSASNKVE